MTVARCWDLAVAVIDSVTPTAEDSAKVARIAPTVRRPPAAKGRPDPQPATISAGAATSGNALLIGPAIVLARRDLSPHAAPTTGRYPLGEARRGHEGRARRRTRRLVLTT